MKDCRRIIQKSSLGGWVSLKENPIIFFLHHLNSVPISIKIGPNSKRGKAKTHISLTEQFELDIINASWVAKWTTNQVQLTNVRAWPRWNPYFAHLRDLWSIEVQSVHHSHVGYWSPLTFIVWWSKPMDIPSIQFGEYRQLRLIPLFCVTFLTIYYVLMAEIIKSKPMLNGLMVSRASLCYRYIWP